MVATTLEPKVSSLDLFLKKAWEHIPESDPLYLPRQKAWKHFLSLSSFFPHEGSVTGGSAKSSKWRSFMETPFSFSPPPALNFDILPWVYPECQESVIVFVNGCFSPALSRLSALPEKVSLLPLSAALTSYSAFLHNHWNKSLKEEKDPFVLLNQALHQAGAFLLIPSKMVVNQPIQLLHLITKEAAGCALMPRLQIFLGSHARVELLHTQKEVGASGSFVNGLVDAVLEEGSHFEYAQSLLGPSSAFLFEGFRAFLKTASRLTTAAATEGGAIQKTNYRIVLGGERAEALLSGVSFLSEKRESHQQVEMRHESPHCRSFQLFKSVLKERSRSSFTGKILVTQAAQKTEAFQLSNHLILSDHAIAYSDPNLEIFADDVKASHGSTTGQLREEELFYMRTRGLSAHLASELLISGFCEQVVEKFSLPSMRREVASTFSPSLHPAASLR